MSLVEIKLEPGLFTEETARGAVNRWYDGDHIRFRYGLPESIKGWLPYTGAGETQLNVGAEPRAAHDWTSLDNQKWVAFGSAQKLYIINNGLLYDITPLAGSGTLTNPFSTTNGSDIILVTQTEHGLQIGQNISFSGASPVGGLTIDGPYVVVDVPSPDTYTIEASGDATSTATGGGTVSYEYEMSPPPGGSQYLGYGIGPYGLDDDPNYLGTGYGTPRLAANLPQDLSVWSLDNWGQDLIACRLGGPIYVWQRSSGPNTRAQVIPNAPVQNNWVIVSQEDRILISVGSHDGTQRDQSLVRWSNQEDYNDWTVGAGSAAGDKRLDSGSRNITAVRTRGEIIIWTDSAIYSMSPTGTPGDFQFLPRGESLSIVSANARAEAAGVVYAMVRDEFIAYDGVARIMPCTVRNYVFGDIDRDGLQKVYAAVNKEQSEVWWFYPSNGAADNDRYVIYNYREGTWYYGSMDRTAYIDAGFIDYPIAAAPNGDLYMQEIGLLAGESQLNSYIESYDMEIQNIGEKFAHVKEFIPDFLTLEGELRLTFWTRKYPRGAAIVKGPYTIDSDTEKVCLRAKGRQIGIRIEAVTTQDNSPDTLTKPAASSLTLSGGNLVATQGADGAWDSAYGSGRSSGKYVFGFDLSAPGATDPYNLFIGIATANTDGNLTPTSLGLSLQGYTPSRVRVWVDFDLLSGWVELDNVFIGGDPAVGNNPTFTFTAGTRYPVISMFNQITATYVTTSALNAPEGWLPWAGVTETGVTPPSWRFGTLRCDVIPDGER